MRRMLIVLTAPFALTGCVSLDLADYVDEGVAGQAGNEPFAVSRRDCLHAAEPVEARQGAGAGARAYETCMAARGWNRP